MIDRSLALPMNGHVAYAYILDALEQAVVATDLHGYITYWSRCAEQIYGWSAAESIGQLATRIIPDGVLDEHSAAIVANVFAGGRWTGELLVQHRDGRVFPAQVTVSPIVDGAGTLVGLVGMSADISARKAAEAALSASEARYRAVIEQSTEGIFLADAASLRIVEANHTYQQLLGYSAQEFHDLTLYDVVGHAPPSIDYYAERVLRERRCVIGERHHRRKDGTLVDVEVSATLVEDGGAPLFCVVVRDITARKRAERERERLLQQRAAERARMHAVLHQMPAGVVIAEDAAGTSFTINNHAKDLLGVAIDQSLVAQPVQIHRWQPPHDFAASQPGMLLQRAINGEQIASADLDVQHADGAALPLIVSAAPIRDVHNGIAGAVAVFQDARPFREAQVLRELDRLKSMFTASVSHELRTPLHHIKGYVTTLLRPQMQFDAATIREYLEIIDDESDKLERLIVDLLDTSRIETGALVLDIDSVSLDDVVRSAVQRWNARGSHSFRAVLPPDVPPIPADLRRIEQVLDNLLANVVRHTPPGTGGVLEVQVGRDAVSVTLVDNGPGVAPQHVPHLFDRFYQAEPHTFRRGSGNGLGLFISKGVVEQHGGQIGVELLPNGGLLCRFSLPRRWKSTKLRSQATATDTTATT